VPRELYFEWPEGCAGQAQIKSSSLTKTTQVYCVPKLCRFAEQWGSWCKVSLLWRMRVKG